MQFGDIDGFGARRSGQWKEGFSKTPVGGWPSFSRPSPQPFGDHASLPNYSTRSTALTAHPSRAGDRVAHARPAIGACGNDFCEVGWPILSRRACAVRCTSPPSQRVWRCCSKRAEATRRSRSLAWASSTPRRGDVPTLYTAYPGVARSPGCIAVGAQLRLRKSQAPASPGGAPLFSHSPASEEPWLVQPVDTAGPAIR